MTPETFLAEFGHFADAPNGVRKLRELILQLAVQGKLVPQDPGDEPASRLLREIKAETSKSMLGDRRTQLGGANILRSADRQPNLPSGWEWARLGDLGYLLGGGTPSKQNPQFWNGTTPWVSPKDMKRQYISDSIDHISEAAVQNSSVKMIPTGALLMVVRGMILSHSFPVALTTGPVTVNQDMKALVPSVHATAEYLLRCLSALNDAVVSLAERSSHGTCRLDTGDILNLPISLPPLAEQKRIVAKVDQLMALCDELEARKQQRRETRARLNDAALDALLNATDPNDFAAHWQRIGDHFDLLYDHPETLPKLRAAILQLAVQGKLVPQDPGETIAEAQIREAKEKKHELVDRLGLRRQAALQPLTQDEPPYQAPASWSWVRMDDVFLVTGGLQKSPKRKPVRNHYPYLRVANVRRRRLDLGEIARFELAPGELEKLRLAPNDLLVVEGNGSEHEIGRCAVWNGEIADCVHQNHLIRCRPIYPQWSAFVLLFLNAPQGIEEMKRLAITTSGLYNLSVGKIRGIACPIPPPEEQTRIVAKVDQLMALLDALEAKLTRAREHSEKLMEATVRQLAGLAPKPAPAAAPQTPGRVGTAHRLRPGTGTARVGGAHPTTTATSSGAGFAPPKPPAMVGGAHPTCAAAPPAPNGPRRARANGNIPQAILDHMRPGTLYARAEIVDALGISTGEWTWAIRQLKETGKVAKTGQRRGARYQLAGSPLGPGAGEN